MALARVLLVSGGPAGSAVLLGRLGGGVEGGDVGDGVGHVEGARRAGELHARRGLGAAAVEGVPLEGLEARAGGAVAVEGEGGGALGGGEAEDAGLPGERLALGGRGTDNR